MSMSEYDAVRRLWDLGYYFSPGALSVRLVSEDELPGLSLDSEVSKAAIDEYQQAMGPEFSEWIARGFNPPQDEGEIEPEVAALLDMPRCGMPDYLHPAQAVEEANWPEACREHITTSYRMTLSGVTDSGLERIWQEADQNWEKAIEVAFQFRPAEYPNTRIFAFAARLGGNVLADQFLATNSCSFRSQGRVDSDRTWSEKLLIATLSHEHGHALGLSHSQDSNALMYPSITQASMGRNGAPTDSDIQAAIRLGYKRRIVAPPPSPPEGITITVSGFLGPGQYRLIKV